MGSMVGVMQVGSLHLRGSLIDVAGDAARKPAPTGEHPRYEIARAMPQAFSRRFSGRAEMLKNRVVTVR